MYHGQPEFIRYVPWNLALKLGGFMVHFLINHVKHCLNKYSTTKKIKKFKGSLAKKLMKQGMPILADILVEFNLYLIQGSAQEFQSGGLKLM